MPGTPCSGTSSRWCGLMRRARRPRPRTLAEPTAFEWRIVITRPQSSFSSLFVSSLSETSVEETWNTGTKLNKGGVLTSSPSSFQQNGRRSLLWPCTPAITFPCYVTDVVVQMQIHDAHRDLLSYRRLGSTLSRVRITSLHFNTGTSTDDSGPSRPSTGHNAHTYGVHEHITGRPKGTIRDQMKQDTKSIRGPVTEYYRV